MKQIKIVNPEKVSSKVADKYKVREAARAVVLDSNGLMALLHATKDNYYKLPGGGIEIGETKEAALGRECKEEIGCTVKIINELGFITEYRKKYEMRQVSYCYLAQVIGEKGVANLEKDEIEEGFETVWLPIKEATKKILGSQKAKYEASHMVLRDSSFLKVAKKLLKIK